MSRLHLGRDGWAQFALAPNGLHGDMLPGIRRARRAHVRQITIARLGGGDRKAPRFSSWR